MKTTYSAAALRELSRLATSSRRVPALCAVDLQRGDDPADAQGLLPNKTFPKKITDQLKAAAKAYRENALVRQICRQQCAFYNYGLAIKIRGKAWTPDPLPGMSAPELRARVARWVRQVWLDRVVYRNVVSFFRENGAWGAPMTIDPASCRYTNALGLERLEWEPGYSPEDLRGLSARERERFLKTVRITDGENGERFRVLTDGRVGSGFSPPTLLTVQRALQQMEGMEVGGNLLGYLCRTVLRQHLLGHEIKSGPLAGLPKHFYTEARGNKVRDYFKSKIGFAEFASNFDHAIKLHVVGAEHFDAKKWEDVIARLLWWGGPAAFMLVTRQVNPFLMPMFQEEAAAEREAVGEHLESMLSLVLGEEVRVGWSQRCFRDGRLALDMLKFGVTQGPVSLTSATRDCGYDPEEERGLKREEAQAPTDELMPLFDAQHGQRPAAPGERAGRKMGSPDQPS